MNVLSHIKKIHHALGGLEGLVIHIAGSKGKGTVATLLAKILELHGKKVGLFVSPPIICDEEMIQVNGKEIENKMLHEKLMHVRSVANTSEEKLSEFEELTLAALLHFNEEHCSYVVLECGWGGKDDATNIVDEKVLTILAHVELEHTEVLGKTLAEITRQKLGICRHGVPLLTLPTQSEEVLEEIEKSEFTPIVAPAVTLGHHHPESAGLAVMAADLLGFPIDSVIQKALEKMVIPGRFEIIPFGIHTLILEGAHTYDSISYFLEQLRRFEEENHFTNTIFAIHLLKDKREDLWTLFPITQTVWVPLDDERAGAKPDLLLGRTARELLSNLGREQKPQLLVFCGSFKLVAEVKRTEAQ